MAKASKSSELYTLTEVSTRTGISMPTLQRYKKLYQDRIPSEGRGRSQRYPEDALEVFRQLKEENMGRRGRPRNQPAGDDGGRAESGGGGRRGSRIQRRRERRRGRAGRAESGASEGGAGASETTAKRGGAKKSAAGGGGGGGDLLTLTQIGEITGISYPTLMRYVKAHGDDIPHEGSGRRRRYKPEAVDVFRDLRSRSRRGRRPASEKSDEAPKPAARGRRAASSSSSSGDSGSSAASSAGATGGRSSGSRATAGGDGDVGKRLASLEAAVSRIEQMLSGGLHVRFGKG